MAGGTDVPPLHTRLFEKFNDDVPTDWLSRCIFKVPNHLRQLSERAYEPKVISIGPYHHGKAPLKKMEEYKKYSLKMLLDRRTESSLERYVTALKDREEQARKFYSEPLNHISGEEFVEMMLLDGCFIVELIRKSAMKELKDENEVSFWHFILRKVKCDLLLFENQLPFFILSELFDMTVMPEDKARDFIGIAIDFFSKIMPVSLRRPKDQDIKHLLGLLHDSCCKAPPQEVRISCSPEKGIRSPCSKAKLKAMAIPSSSSLSQSTEKDQEIEIGPSASMSSCKFDISSQCPEAKLNCSSEELRSSPSISRELDSMRGSDPNRKKWRFIRSATKLEKAGINFKNIEGRLFDIGFQEGVMSIPTLRIDDDTESLFRNLVAYEQCFKDEPSKCFTNYIKFMDCLIDTWKDVELLSHHGVIDNWLGDHKAVAVIFNGLSEYVSISKKHFCYAGPFRKVNKYCDRKPIQWKATLWNNRWGVISIYGLVFTILQTFFTVLPLLRK